MLESISNGVPMICWPFFADQQMSCWWSCNKWGVSMEIDNDVKSDSLTLDKLSASLERNGSNRSNERRGSNGRKVSKTYNS
ncbi:putative 7-deoxyloganetin glucosyltransferase [Helianthus annuus]|uniref:7-deoxyloganetin glucosyltransferase n=1 Tax=Helianthus annuus TaxID=4232 RepID=A0A9K3J3C4_HELAN|nr:putative 7-deoxyloganetin glucosyltransferase [Helianthus annuus]KAJ0790575.1 putative 7-deoxyloganetin glucosyltransferase [Helianthus annuus]